VMGDATAAAAPGVESDVTHITAVFGPLGR